MISSLGTSTVALFSPLIKIPHVDGFFVHCREGTVIVYLFICVYFFAAVMGITVVNVKYAE